MENLKKNNVKYAQCFKRDLGHSRKNSSTVIIDTNILVVWPYDT